MPDILKIALEKGLGGLGIDGSEAAAVVKLPDESLYELLSVTDAVRRRFKGIEISFCSIVNAKSGLCREDCSFCSQSAKYRGGVEEYPLLQPGDIAAAATNAGLRGAREFSIVTSGTSVEKEKDLAVLEDALVKMKEAAAVERCASLGIMSRENLKRLQDAGLESYHHNLETSRAFFPNVCTTHDYEDDVRTVKAAKELGLHVCSGGIFGLGESWDDRIDLAVTLKELGADSVPINFLNPRPGTPLEKAENLTPVECLRIIALFRLVLPDKDIVVCGGRRKNLKTLEPLIFAAGASAILTGDYLTTKGNSPEEDKAMLKDLGLRPRGF